MCESYGTGYEDGYDGKTSESPNDPVYAHGYEAGCEDREEDSQCVVV